MSVLRPIAYGSPEYDATLALRNRVMRVPLGLNIYNEDFSCEAASHIIGIFEGDTLLATGIMYHRQGVCKIEYLCVDFHCQSRGLGGQMLEYFVDTARRAGADKVILEARLKARPFYQRHGFTAKGEIFTVPIAPVPHIFMEKVL